MDTANMLKYMVMDFVMKHDKTTTFNEFRQNKYYEKYYNSGNEKTLAYKNDKYRNQIINSELHNVFFKNNKIKLFDIVKKYMFNINWISSPPCLKIFVNKAKFICCYDRNG